MAQKLSFLSNYSQLGVTRAEVCVKHRRKSRHESQRSDIRTANRYMKRGSASGKHTNRDHKELSPHTCQDGYHQKDETSQLLMRVWRERNPHVHSVGMEIGAAMMENDTEVPQKHENQNYHSPWGDTSKGSENQISKRYVQSRVHCNTLLNSRGMETTQRSVN